MIHVNERFAIDGEDRNYMVIQKGVSEKTGEATRKTIAYCQNIDHCVDVIYKRETRAWIQKHDSDLHTALVAFKEIKQDIIAAIKGV